MSLLRKLFGYSEVIATPPDVRFGRFSDHYKSVWSRAALERAEQLFSEKKYTDSFRNFFDFLKNEEEDNVRYRTEQGVLQFEILQGSRSIRGTADARHFRAVSRIVRMDASDEQFLHRFVFDNYRLRHCRFALDPENYLSVVFDCPGSAAAPYKLYQALRETALLADRLDDLLQSEFDLPLPPNEGTRTELPRRERRIRIDYVRREIESTLFRARTSALAADYPGAFTYALLHLCYKLDYLTKPEGYVSQQIGEANARYFNRENSPMRVVNEQIIGHLDEILRRSDAQLADEFYRVRFTFGLTEPVTHERIARMVRAELPRADWYLENGYPEVALHMAGYLVGYALYHYAPPPADRELFHLFFRITEPEFCAQIGYSDTFSHAKQGLNAPAIRQELGRWRNRYRPVGITTADLDTLDCSDLNTFALTYLALLARYS